MLMITLYSSRFVVCNRDFYDHPVTTEINRELKMLDAISKYLILQQGNLISPCGILDYLPIILNGNIKRLLASSKIIA